LATGDLEKKQQSPFDELSARELEVLPYLLKGMTVTQIAEHLSVHTSTIGTQKARIFGKLGVTNLVELNRMSQLFAVSR